MVVKELFAKLGLEVDHGVFNAAEKALGNIKLGALAIGGAIAAAAGAMYHLMAETRDYAFEASKAAQRTGLTVEAWQEMQAAAGATGLSADTLEHSLILMSKAAYGASEGSEQMVETFKALGVHTKDAAGELKAPDILLQDLAEKFHSMPDGIKKTALATKAFGRSGAQMLPFLNKGAEGIEELRHHAHELGLVLDQETIEASIKWKKEIKLLHEQIEGFKLQLGSKLLKAFMAFKVQLGKVFTALNAFFKTLAKHWKETVIALAAGAALLIGWNATLVGSYIAAGAAAIVAGLKSAAAWLLAAAPMIGLIALIAAMLILLEDFLKTLDGGDTLITRYGEKWSKFVDDFLRVDNDDWWVTKKIKEALQALMDLDGYFRKRLSTNSEVRYDPGFKPTPGNGLPSEGLGGSLKRMLGLEVGVPWAEMKQPASVFGGGTSPQAAVSSAGGKPPVTSFNATVNVQAQTGANPHDIAHAVRSQLEDFHDTKMREAAAAAH